MITKPKAKKFRIRRGGILGVQPDPATDMAQAAMASPPLPKTEQVQDSGTAQDIDAIRREGLTGRQLRLARRVAQKHGLAVTSDFDAVRQLRSNGIDPFQRSTLLSLVTPGGGATAETARGAALDEDRIQLPQTIPQGGNTLPSTERASPADKRASDILRIQRDIARRRRRKLALLFTRLATFVFLPTFLVGWYYFVIATPMFATNSEFVIQQAEPAAASAGLGGMFQGTSMGTQTDSITVQSFLESRSAMLRLDEEHGFRAHFSDEGIDLIQRLDPEATNEAAFKIYSSRVKLSYDPTEGILRMEVIAASPEVSQQFSEALIGYAEEQVDQLTQRLRETQMSEARASYEAAELRRSEARAELLRIQEEVQQIDPQGETAARTQQISALETERQRLSLQLQDRLGVRSPNQAQVDALRSQIANIEALIADMRQQMTAASDDTGTSLAARNTDLRLAEENYSFQTILVQQALTQMETAQVEANRQVRYLSLGVPPVAPDEATYPRAFENTILAFLVFAGIYLMISLTASILREQVTS